MTQPDLSIFETSTPVDENQPDLTIFENTQNPVIAEAVKVNPAEQAKLNRLSRESQLPADMIEGDLQGIEQDLKTQSIDLSKSPKTADWMSKYENAAVAHTDVNTLKNVELTMADIPLGIDYKVTPEVEPETVKDLLKAWGRGSGYLVSSLGQLLSVVESGGNQLAARAENIVRAGVGAEPIVPTDTAVSDWLREIGNQTTTAPVYEPSQYSRDRAADVQAAEGFFGTIKAFGENPSQIFEGVVQSAPSFIGPAAITKIAGIAYTAKTVAVTSGAIEGGAAGADARQQVLNMSFADMVEDSPRYVDMVAQGVDPQKAKEILAEEAGLTATAITVPIATLLTKATGAADIESQFFTDQKVFNTFAKWLRGTGVEAVEETGQSATSQVATNVGVGTTGDQTRDPLQGVGEAAAQGTVLGAVQAGGIKSVDVVRDIFHDAMITSHAIKQRESVFVAQQKTIDKLAELSDQAELKKLDAESFKQFVNHIDGDRDTRVHLDAVQTQLYLNSLGDKTDPAITMLREALGEAATLGYDVTIPVGDFAVTIAGSPHFEALREFMSLSENSPSPFRKESDDAAAREYLRSLIDTADENVTLHQQKQQYADQVREQLVDTGRMNAKDAVMSATVVPEWAASFAKRNGMTLEQVKQQLDLKIEGPLSGELSRLTNELQKFDQSKLKVLNKEKADLLISEISNMADISEDGLITVYHRTTKENAEKIKSTGVITPKENGIFFSTKKDGQVSGYGDDVVELTIPADMLELDDIFDDEAHLRLPAKVNKENDISSFIQTDTSRFNQFAGVNSRTAIMNDLERAKQMREKGLGNDATARQTGWFLGVDGRWRYEISDDQAKWRVVPKPSADLRIELDELSQKIYGVPFDKLPRVAEGTGERQNIIRRHDNLNRLDNYLDHPELFKAYPQLGSIQVTVDDNMDDGDLGVYFERQNTIQLNSKSSPEQMLSTVLHELQHAIQSIEDFARGGSMNADFTTSVKNAIQNLSKGKTEEAERWEWRNQWKIKAAEKAAEISRNGVMYRSAMRLIDYANRDKPSSVFRHIRNESQWIYGEQFYGNREANDLQRMFFDMPRSGAKRNEAIRKMSHSIGEFLLKQIPEDQLHKFKNDERTTDSMLKALSREASLLRRGLKPFQELKAEAKRAVELDQATLIKNPYEVYRALAGEIEARTTQNRMKLTPEQRRTRPVSLDQDLPSSEAIVVVGGMEIKVPEAMMSQEQPESFNQIGLHSAVESTVETMNLPAWKNGGSANGTDVWAKLQSSPGVKKEELKWLGIEEFLTAEPRKFSRDEVMQFVKTNGVQVVEVVADKSEDTALGELNFVEDNGDETVDYWAQDSDGNYNYRIWIPDDSETTTWVIDFNGNEIGTAESLNEAEIQASAHARENGFIVESEAEIARFADYITEIPGSSPENYRELKLTLPNIKDQFVYKAHFSDPNIVAFMRVSDRKQLIPSETKFTDVDYKIEIVNNPIRGSLVKTLAQVTVDGNEIYQLGLRDDADHDVVKNSIEKMIKDNKLKTIGGLYINSGGAITKRTKTVDNKTFFIEELQSDWHQQGRQKGYKTGDFNAHGVPDAPFKNDEWISLSLKRALVIAAKEGYTSVAWPNAEVLMDRWSDEYETLYRNLYDGKVKSIIKKLTKQEPVTTSFNGRFGYDEGLGYHSITITPELREQILTDSFNLFQKSRGYYEPKNSLIRLNESSNLSTFLHEFAHAMYEMELVNNGSLIGDIHAWFKRNAKDVAAEAQTIINQQIPDFTKPPTIVTSDDVVAYLDNKTTGDTDKDSALRIATHEQFARGYEAYLMEGKSPSEELRDVFRTFTRWLVAIYKNIRGLNVKLDDDARRFFDRLTATDVQIRAAQARANYSAMFNDASMAGMSDREFEKYQQQKQRVKDKADETLRDKMIAQLRRRTEKWWREEKQDVVDQVKVELNNQPVYRAINGMRSGTVKMDHQAVLDLFGEDVTNAVGIKSRRIPTALRNMTVKGAQGVRPDDAAAFFGFASASEMVEQIKSTPSLNKAADEKAEQIMVDRHGDILNDGTIEKEADEAVQNEERAELLLMELKALAKGSRIPVIDRQVLKATAEDAIAKLSYREIHPAKYRRAEIRAAQESAVALKNGNREEATRAKARQLMNHYLANAATDARNETMRIVDSMSRYSKKKVREEIMKAEGGYWEQIVNILSRFEFRKSATLDQVDQVNQGINLWAKERIEVDGDGLVLSPVVLNELYQTHWKNVKFSDLKGIADSVKNIEYVARYSNKLTRMGDELEFKQLVTRWVDHLKQQPVRFSSQRTDTIRGKNWGRWAMAQMTKIPYLCSWLDGGERVGLSHQILMQPLNDAYSKELALWKTVGNDVLKALESRSAEDRKRHATKIFIKEIQDEKNDGNLFGSQILAVALNTGNESNLRKMLLGEGWANPDDDTTISMNNPQLKAVLKHMTKSDWDLVQLLWDKMEELYPQLAEVHRRTTGLTPPKIEATKITTPFGEYRGGYYPVKYDPARSFKSELNEEKLNAQTESMFATSGSIQASVNASATNERTKYYAPINLNLDVIPNHFQETIHYITHHDAVREINKLLRNPSVAEAIKGVVGPEEYAQLRPWLNDVAKDGREAPAKMFWDAVLQRLRFGVTLGSMGFKVSTAIMQLSGLSNTVAEVGIKNVYQSLRTILGSPKTMQSAWGFASENSKILKYRTQTMDREIKNALNQLAGKNGMLAAAQELSMKHIAYTQTFAADLPSWYAAYIKKMDETGDEQKAFQYADWVVENIQGSGATKDMARIMRGQSEAGKMFTMFMTFFSALWNMERDLVKGVRNKTYSVTTVGAKVAFLFTLPVLFEMLVRGEFGGDDEDDETLLQKTLTKTALFPFQSIPFARDMINGATGDYGYNISPIASLMEQGMQSIPELIKRPLTDEEITKSQVKGATKFIGAALGIPGTSQAWSTGESLYDVLVVGEDRTIREILVTGPDKQ